MPDIPTTEPQDAFAGDTWAWTRTLADYPAPTWVLKYRFKNESGGFELTAAASGTDHAVTATAATTAAYASGIYSWVAWVEGGSSEKYTVDQGTVTVLPDFRATAAATALDTRSHARKALALVEAAIEALNLGVKAYPINNRSMTKRDLPELVQMRDAYKVEVAREEAAEKIANGLGNPKRFYVRWGQG